MHFIYFILSFWLLGACGKGYFGDSPSKIKEVHDIKDKDQAAESPANEDSVSETEEIVAEKPSEIVELVEEENSDPGTEGPQDESLIEVGAGLEDGNFDVVSFDGKGKKIAHVKEFDDLYDTNGIVFHGPLNFKEEDEKGKNKGKDKDKDKSSGLALNIGGAEEFKVHLLNADLSTSCHLEINDVVYNHQKLPPVDRLYTLEGSSENYLDKLAIFFSVDAINTQTIKTSTPSCVEDDIPGPNNERRNGVCTVEILDNNDVRLWEIAVYSHDGDCN